MFKLLLASYGLAMAALLAAPTALAVPDEDDLLVAQTLRDAYDGLRTRIGRVIVGQDEVLEQLLEQSGANRRPSPRDSHDSQVC